MEKKTKMSARVKARKSKTAPKRASKPRVRTTRGKTAAKRASKAPAKATRGKTVRKKSPAAAKKSAAAKRASQPRAKATRGKTIRRKNPAAAKKSTARKKAVATKKPASRRKASRNPRSYEEPRAGLPLNMPPAARGVGPDAGGQSGATEGLSRVESADSESVEELVEEGQAFEAGIVEGVENAPGPESGGVRTRQVPEDDVPQEYLDED